jgi:hypothetical protein
MIKCEGDNINRAKNMGVIGQGREETRMEKP